MNTHWGAVSYPDRTGVKLRIVIGVCCSMLASSWIPTCLHMHWQCHSEIARSPRSDIDVLDLKRCILSFPLLSSAQGHRYQVPATGAPTHCPNTQGDLPFGSIQAVPTVAQHTCNSCRHTLIFFGLSFCIHLWLWRVA